MRILHFYPKDNGLIAQHVAMLAERMGQDTDHHLATEGRNACTLLQGSHYDILHVHGCWRTSTRKVVGLALSQGIRLVVTPHGQLEPWVQEENYWKEKLPKRVLFQQSVIRRAYAVIIHHRCRRTEAEPGLLQSGRCKHPRAS